MIVDKRAIRTLSIVGQRGALGMGLLDIRGQKGFDNLLVMTADLCNTSGLDRFRDAFPDSFINVGIAEQNMVSMAAGLAKEGFNVFVTSFANFLSMRAVEQARTEVAYMGLDVTLVGLASGFSMGFFGNTHYGIEDIAIMRSIPNMRVVSPADGLEVCKSVEALCKVNGPSYLRLTGVANLPSVYLDDYEFVLGKAITLRKGRDVVIVATGSVVSESLAAADLLASSGIEPAVINMHTLKPIDLDCIDDIYDMKPRLLVTVEEHNVVGGLGDAIASRLAIRGGQTFQFLKLGIDDKFLIAGDYHYLLEACGLTAKQIAESILEQLNLSTRD